jgi:hypothetical protein
LVWNRCDSCGVILARVGAKSVRQSGNDMNGSGVTKERRGRQGAICPVSTRRVAADKAVMGTERQLVFEKGKSAAGEVGFRHVTIGPDKAVEE